MKFFIALNILFAFLEFFNKTTVINDYLLKAETAYQNKQYKEVIKNYEILITKYHHQNEEISFNLAQAYYNLGDTSSCKKIYKKLTGSDNNLISSNAYQQLGNLAWFGNNKNEAIKYYINALKANSNNQVARENLEIVKKIIQKDKANIKDRSGISKFETDQLQESETQGNSGEGNSDSQSESRNISSGIGSKIKSAVINQLGNFGKGKSKENSQNELNNDQSGNKESESLQTNKLQELKISEQKARMILEAMNNSEVQYLQQRRISTAKKDLPDW